MRTHAYTAFGLNRLRCRRCGGKATEQWMLRPCATGRKQWHPLCTECDVELNRIAMDFVRLPDADELLAAYRKKKGLT